MKTLAKRLVWLGVLGPVSAWADTTVTQSISQILYNAAADYAWFIGPAAWGAAGCPTATLIEIPANQPGKDKLYATALAAYAAGKNVQFYGTCSTQVGYFDVNYIVVSG